MNQPDQQIIARLRMLEGQRIEILALCRHLSDATVLLARQRETDLAELHSKICELQLAVLTLEQQSILPSHTDLIPVPLQ
jgi:hypothetical protein